ncbi:MAG: HAD-IIIA family hydrolase [Bdellovibrionales bacterium]|nr:HAD-IIIA family hydrolase [Bdellovibrionales bacterium]
MIGTNLKKDIEIYFADRSVSLFDKQLYICAQYERNLFIDQNINKDDIHAIETNIKKLIPRLSVKTLNIEVVKKIGLPNDLVITSAFEATLTANQYVWSKEGPSGLNLDQIKKIIVPNLNLTALNSSPFNQFNDYCIPALFLDRDGVIIEYQNYPSDPNEIKVRPGISNIIKTANKKGWPVVIISNQSGIGRGLLNWRQLHSVNQKIKQLLCEEKCWIDHVEVSSFIEKSSLMSGVSSSSLRKPLPGMFIQSSRLLNIDLKKSIMIGDRFSDFCAAKAAQLKKYYHLSNPHHSNDTDKIRSLTSEPQFEINVLVSPEEIDLNAIFL